MSIDFSEAMPWLVGPTVHVLRVELAEVEPTVWRSFALASDTKLPKFNRLLEAAMGWEGYHLHRFVVGQLHFGPPDSELRHTIDERKITVEQLLPEVGSALRWDYDFGDGWEHHVVVEAITAVDQDVRYPLCTAGEHACPPEDCGGPWGYRHLRNVLADPADPEHAHLSEWAGPGFDPSSFTVEHATRSLRRVR